MGGFLNTVIASAIESVVLKAAVGKKLPYVEYLPTGGYIAIFIVVATINIGLYLFYTTTIYPYFLSPLRHLPQPPNVRPYVGNVGSMFSRPPGQKIIPWLDNVPNDGLILSRGIGNSERLIVCKPKALADILVHKSYEFEKPGTVRRFLSRVLGDGLIVVEGNQHKFQRKNLSPAFNVRHIKDLYPLFWDKSQRLVDAMTEDFAKQPQKQPGKIVGVAEMGVWCSRVAMDIIGIAALGREMNTLQNHENRIMEIFEDLLEPTVEKLIYFVVSLILPKKMVESIPIVFRNAQKVMGADMKDLQGQAQGMVKDKKVSTGKEVDILSILLRTNQFTDENLVDQLLTFLAAGHETTANALTWALYLMSRFPDIQEELREEVRKAIPGRSADVSSDLLEKMPLLNGVGNEALRLYPGVPMTVREAMRDTELNGVKIPKGTECFLVPYAINRSKELWGEDAQRFNPERWIEGEGENRRPNNNGGATSNYAFMTFLHGPRSCIGQNFSKAELRCLLAIIIGSFKVSMADPMENVPLSGVITLKPEFGMNLRMEFLNGWE